jgi:hypothetical protein
MQSLLHFKKLNSVEAPLLIGTSQSYQSLLEQKILLHNNISAGKRQQAKNAKGRRINLFNSCQAFRLSFLIFPFFFFFFQSLILVL